MDSIVNIIQYGLIGLVAFFVIGWLGFRIPSRVKTPSFEPAQTSGTLSGIPADVPEPMQKHLLSIYGASIPSISSVTAWGRGRISAKLRLLGNVWLPFSWTLYLLPGESYLWKVNITWFMRSFIRGGDLYKDGKGQYSMGREIIESEFMDLSQFTILWINTLIYAPAALLTIPNLSWQSVDAQTVWLTVPGDAKAGRNFKLLFNAAGNLERIETKRAASRDGTLLDFAVTLKAHSEVSLPQAPYHQLINAWENDTYLTQDVSGIVYDSEVILILSSGL